jgi:tetratricopeptide (TPR) repeat protein
VVLENLSLIFIKQGRFARAERVLKRAISKDTSPHSACRLKYKLAQLYLLQGRYLLAETITGEASALAELCPVRDINMESEQLLRLANLWHHWGADQIALQHYKKVQEIRRSTLFSANAHSTMQQEQGQLQGQLQEHLQGHLQEEEEEEEKQSLD